MMKVAGISLLLAILAAALLAEPAPARIRILRSAGPITIDGDLSDPGWKGAAEISTFYEVQPGDSTPPKVATVALLTYDDRFLYVAIRCDDPNPKKIRAQFNERDHAFSDQDLAAILLDTRNDERTALELFVNPYGVQDDLVRDESTASGTREDFAPDFYWDAAAKITSSGWQVEMRVPFSTLRYSAEDPQTWGIVVFRNYPRDFRYQIASNPAPRDSLCFVCHATKIEGLTGLPHGAHFVAAPYGTLTEQGIPRGGPGGPYVNRPARGDGGLDAKFLPNENMAIDATINPDFSQVESDVAQITADARFALFYPEKRPFFMEQSQLFTTPIQAVYTRTLTSPRWGVRATGQFDSNAYTLLAGQDRGGGTVILPGSAASSTAAQDFHSIFGIGRVQHAFAGRSYVSLLATDREIEGGGYNRVFGPDFQWTPGDHDQVVGQFLLSATRTPNRPDLSTAWTGQSLGSRALSSTWNHSSYHWNWTATYRDLGENFRADDGFVPQVGIREGIVNASYVFYTTGFFSRVTPVVVLDSVADAAGDVVTKLVEPGVAFQGRSNLFAEIDYNAHEQERAGPNLLRNERWHVSVSFNPPGLVTSVSLDGHVGKSIDFVGNRGGHGGDFTFSTTGRPTRHLQIDANLAGQWLDFEGRRLFTAQIERLKATYVFSRTTFVRVIGQYLRTDFHPERYPVPVPKVSGGFQGSALFGYQVNWQTVLYAGYGDTRVLSNDAQLLSSGRQLFVKLSYAFQR